MAGKHRESGGKRATAARHAVADALKQEHAAWNNADARAFARLPKHPPGAAGAAAEAMDALRLALRRCAQNPALVPQQRHEQIGRIAAALVKVADPGKLVDEQAALLADAERRIEELEARLRAAPKPTGDRRQPPAPPLQ